MYTREQFTAKYSPFIAKAVKGTGLLAGTVLAQAIIESQGNVGGAYYVGASKLSQNSNNYFGIKCHNWKGKTYNISTGEYKPSGEYFVDKNACFRSYNNVEDSIKDYVKFLKENPRYEAAGVFKAKTVREQAEALKKAGYATALNYPATIESVYNGIKNSIIEATEFQKKIVTKYWWVIGLGIVGTVGLVYAVTRK